MTYVEGQSSTKPESVVMEKLPDGSIRVILHADITATKDDDGTVYQYKEVDFILPDDRQETQASIKKSFDAWWAYATEDHTPPTIEERLELLEEIVYGEEDEALARIIKRSNCCMTQSGSLR